MSELTHLDDKGRAQMVDVAEKGRDGRVSPVRKASSP